MDTASSDIRTNLAFVEVKQGVGAAIMIRENFKVPIIFCTSYAATGAIQLAVQSLGNAALISKPFDETEMAALLANAVKKQQRDGTLGDLRPS